MLCNISDSQHSNKFKFEHNVIAIRYRYSSKDITIIDISARILNKQTIQIIDILHFIVTLFLFDNVPRRIEMSNKVFSRLKDVKFLFSLLLVEWILALQPITDKGLADKIT